jgi:hypothetical protein
VFFLFDQRFRVDEAWYLDAKEQEFDGASGVSLRFRDLRILVTADAVISCKRPCRLVRIEEVGCLNRCLARPRHGLAGGGRGAGPWKTRYGALSANCADTLTADRHGANGVTARCDLGSRAGMVERQLNTDQCAADT